MTRTEALLFILAEECAEVMQRASKAARFGLTEVQPGQELNNATRISHEMADLVAVFQMLDDEGSLPRVESDRIDAKKAKVEKYLDYSRSLGNVT